MALIANRRKALAKGLGQTTGPLMSKPVAPVAASKAETAVSLSVVMMPPHQWGKDAPPDVFPDPDVLPLDQTLAAPG